MTPCCRVVEARVAAEAFPWWTRRGVRVDGEDLIAAFSKTSVHGVASVIRRVSRHARHSHPLVGEKRRRGFLDRHHPTASCKRARREHLARVQHQVRGAIRHGPQRSAPRASRFTCACSGEASLVANGKGPDAAPVARSGNGGFLGQHRHGCRLERKIFGLLSSTSRASTIKPVLEARLVEQCRCRGRSPPSLCRGTAHVRRNVPVPVRGVCSTSDAPNLGRRSRQTVRSPSDGLARVI
jgi:hypothetical protein